MSDGMLPRSVRDSALLDRLASLPRLSDVLDHMGAVCVWCSTVKSPVPTENDGAITCEGETSDVSIRQPPEVEQGWATASTTLTEGLKLSHVIAAVTAPE